MNFAISRLTYQPVASARASRPDTTVTNQTQSETAPSEILSLSGLEPLETPKKAIRKIVKGLGYTEFPQVSPDGKTLVFNVVGDYTTSQLMSVPARGGKVHALDSGERVTPENVGEYLQSHQGSICEQATFDQSGNLLYRTNQNGTFDIGSYNFTDKNFQMVAENPNLNLKHPVQLDDGRIAIYGGPPTPERPTSEQYSNLYLLDPTNSEMKQLTHSEGAYAYKHPAPVNGKIVAHREDKQNHDVSDLISLDPEGGPETLLTETPTADEKHAFYNKKRDLMVYHRKVEGDKNLVLSTPDGSRTAQLTFYGHPAQSPCWSPDGKEIYFVKKDVRQADGEPFYHRQAEVRALDVKDALKDLAKQAQKRLKKLKSEGADETTLALAREQRDNYEYFLRRY
ncbi:MAG: PD40 domain-containing protein [Candidatus Eremiobacteraeota bacterium]|nr:PD40 domain-containing protein [Candidatus Eremiobacteraeota bacterium]